MSRLASASNTMVFGGLRRSSTISSLSSIFPNQSLLLRSQSSVRAVSTLAKPSSSSSSFVTTKQFHPRRDDALLVGSNFQKSQYHTLAPEPEPQTQLIYNSPNATNCWVISKIANVGTYLTLFGFPFVISTVIPPLWAAVASISAINICFATRKAWNYFTRPFVGSMHILPCNTKVVIQTNNAGTWLHEVVELNEIRPIITEEDSWEPPCSFVVGNRRYEIEGQYFADEDSYHLFESILSPKPPLPSSRAPQQQQSSSPSSQSSSSSPPPPPPPPTTTTSTTTTTTTTTTATKPKTKASSKKTTTLGK